MTPAINNQQNLINTENNNNKEILELTEEREVCIQSLNYHMDNEQIIEENWDQVVYWFYREKEISERLLTIQQNPLLNAEEKASCVLATRFEATLDRAQREHLLQKHAIAYKRNFSQQNFLEKIKSLPGKVQTVYKQPINEIKYALQDSSEFIQKSRTYFVGHLKQTAKISAVVVGLSTTALLLSVIPETGVANTTLGSIGSGLATGTAATFVEMGIASSIVSMVSAEAAETIALAEASFAANSGLVGLKTIAAGSLLVSTLLIDNIPKPSLEKMKYSAPKIVKITGRIALTTAIGTAAVLGGASFLAATGLALTSAAIAPLAISTFKSWWNKPAVI